jgi:hypothetical protein
MNKIAFLTVALALGTIAVETSAAPRILIDLDVTTPQIDSVKMAAAGTLTIGIYAKNAVNLDSYSFDVSFNPAVLGFQTAAEDNSFAGLANILKKNGGQTLNVNLGLKKGCNDTVNINNTLQGSDSAKAPDGDGLLGLIQFTVLEALPCTLSLHNAVFLDYEGVMDTSMTVTQGKLTPYVFTLTPDRPAIGAGKGMTRGVVYAFLNEDRCNKVKGLIYDIRGKRIGTGNLTATGIPAGMYFVK